MVFSDSPQENGVAPRGRILVVDDESELTAALCEMLEKQGYLTSGYSNAKAALEAFQEQAYDILLADLMMPGMDGVALLRAALEMDPYLIGIIMTGQGTVQTAVEAMKSGAFDYILKPFKLNALLATLDRSLEVRRLRMENVQLRELLNIYELGQVVAFTLEPGLIFQKTVTTALEQCQADEASILLPVRDEEALVLVATSGGEREHLIGQKVPAKGTIAGWVAQNLEPVLLDGEVRDARFAPAHPRPEIRSAISMPMVLGNQLVGVINVNLVRRRQPLTTGQIKGLAILASIAASALENARLYVAVQQELQARNQRERELRAIAAVSASLGAASAQGEMIPAILSEVCDLMEAEAATLGILDPLHGEVVLALGVGEWSDRTGERIPAGEGIIGLVIESGQPYANQDLRTEPRYLHPNRIGELRAVACIPLHVQRNLIGVLAIARHTALSEAELRLLISLGDITASSIQRAGLHEQTEKRLRRLSALRKIDLAISSSIDLRVILSVLLDQVVAELGVDAAAILLYHAQTQILDYADGRGFRTGLLERSHSGLGTGYSGRAALERRTIQVPDLAESDSDPLREGLLSAEGLRTCFATPLIAKGEVEGVLEVFHRAPFTPDPEWLEFLEALAGQAAIAIDSARLFEGLQQSNQQLVLAYNATIEGWSRALDLRDKETEGHTQRVTEMTLRLARRMGAFDDEEMVHIRRGALLHDIGKMGVPDRILLKPGDLTAEEWEVMRKHPVFAYQLLSPIGYLRKALDIPYYHHEWWDGSGYPQGIRGEQIPLAARIFSVVDVWDALRSDRPYRAGWPREKVHRYLREHAGTQFDPQVTEVFIQLVAEDGL